MIDQILLVISTTTCGILMAIGGIMTLIYAKQKSYKIMYLFSANWLLQSICWFLIAYAHGTYSTLSMSIAFIFNGLGVLCLTIFLELIEKERVSPSKISGLVVIITIYWVLTFLPGSMEIVPAYGIHIIGNCRLFQIILLIIYFSLYFFWSLKTWRKSPSELKSEGKLIFIGGLMFSYVALTFYMLGSFLIPLNSIGFIINSIGAFITIIVIKRDAKIIYILPFKAYRLSVFETNGGLALFSYNWAPLTELPNEIFSGMLQGIGTLLNEFLDKGTLREISLDQATLIIQYNKSYPIASVLVTSKSSKALKHALTQFNTEFIQKFSTGFDKFNNISQFDGAKAIVEKVFDFVPNYK